MAVFGEWMSNFDGSGLGCEFLQKLIIDLCMDEYSRSGATSLSMIPTNADKYPSSNMKEEGEELTKYQKQPSSPPDRDRHHQK